MIISESICVRPSASYASILPVSEVILPVRTRYEFERTTGIDIVCQIFRVSAFQIYLLGFWHVSLSIHHPLFDILRYAISDPISLSHISYFISHISYLILSSLTTCALVSTTCSSIHTHIPRTTSVPSRVPMISITPSVGLTDCVQPETTTSKIENMRYFIRSIFKKNTQK